MNDKLANRFLTVWLGQDIGEYRRVHFEHHRELGTPNDPERSYFREPGWRLLVETLLLVHLLRVFSTHTAQHEKKRNKSKTPRNPMMLGMLLNGGVVLALFLAGGLAPAMSWILGILCFFPFFSTWRQLLEHRHPKASAGVDYSKVPQGAYTRMFGVSLFERMFGGAGFNRHLLHHWVPEVSYTRFDDLEKRLSATVNLHDIMDARKSGYLRTLKSLTRQKST